MSIKKLYKDIFEKVDYLNKNADNPFLREKDNNNPFAAFFGGTYVWIEPNQENKEE